MKNTANKIIIITALLISLLPFNVMADFKLYTLKGKIKAAFPGQPELILKHAISNIEDRKLGILQHRGYNYVDMNNTLVYSSSFTQYKPSTFPKTNINKGLDTVASTVLRQHNAKLISYKYENIKGIPSVVYHYSRKQEGLDVKTYAVISYKDDCFYSWDVQYVPGHSKKNAKSIFYSYYKNLSKIN